MDKKPAILIAIIAAVAAITLPIVLSIQFARQQGLAAEESKALSYARGVLHRSDLIADEVTAGFKKLRSVGGRRPCSAAQLAAMRAMDLELTTVQAFGFVSHGKLICSSLGRKIGLVALGPVDYVTRHGMRVRVDATFPFAKHRRFIVLERHGYAAIINKQLSLGVATYGKAPSIVVFTPTTHKIIASHGPLDPQWFHVAGNQQQVTRQIGGYVVAALKSHKHRLSVVAALPMTDVDQRIRDFALLLVPVGALGGIALAIAALYLMRLQQALPTALKYALRHNELFLVYEPIVDLQTGKWVGAEALLRWPRPGGLLVRPDIFIPVAEEGGFIERVTAYVMDVFARDAGDIFARYPRFHIGINVSATDLESQRIVDGLKALREKTNAGKGNFIIEATERELLRAEKARAVLHVIRGEGVQIAIDDFGTGYSGLSYLGTFDLDYLKIDKSFVDTIGTDAATSHVVSHIIEIAKALKLKIIAEGVETEMQAHFLRERGVQFAQGWLFAKPMSFAELTTGLAYSG